MFTRTTRTIAFITVSLMITPAWAALDTDAAVIMIRYDATGSIDPCGSLDDCFEYNDDGTPDWSPEDPWGSTSAWIWDDRTPSATQPLLVDVGPGTYPQFVCDDAGYVTIRGAGREQSIIKSESTSSPDGYAIFVTNCQDLAFIDLGAHGGASGVGWFGGGFSTWSDTDVVGIGDSTVNGAWYDAINPDDWENYPTPFPRGTHYFHGSRVRTIGTSSHNTAAFYSLHGDSWFFGGEILVDIDGSTLAAQAVRLASSAGKAELRVFGTTIRARIASGGSVSNGLIGVLLADADAEFHSHGSIISVMASAGTNSEDVTGIRADGLFAHTPGTAFILDPASGGSAKRLDVVSGTVKSPFLWEAGASPPDITSQHGSDVFVETDCLSGGDCDSTGGEAHMMVYDDTCTTDGPWRDMVTGSCRP